VVFAILSVLPLLGQIDPALSSVRATGAMIAMIVLVADYGVTFWRGRLVPLDWLLIPVATVIAGTALLDPVATTALCVSSLAIQSQYGSTRVACLRLAGLAFAFPITIAIQPVSLGRMMEWNSGPILSLIPHLFMITVMVRVLHASLHRQQLAVDREVLLAGAGRQLIHRTEIEAVRAVVAQTAEALCALRPGTAVLVVRRLGDEAIVDSVVGLPAAAQGVAVPAPVRALFDAIGTDVVALEPAVVAALQEVVTGTSHWRAAAVAGVREDMLLLVGAGEPLSDAEFEAFRTLLNQRSLAEANCGAHAELSYRAHTDALTNLPNRAQFFPRLAAAVDGAVGAEDRVALLMIDLDDFKKVNDTHGHGAGDQLLVEVAARLTEVTGPMGQAARFGGDEFAVLLPDLDDPYSADDLAARLCDRLREPVYLSQGTVRIGASIGVASAMPNLTAADLMRCADIAMYAAKGQGKNRVQRFTRTQHGDLAYLRQMAEHLGYALDRDEIKISYEPLVAPDTGRCVGVMASTYWQHPLLGTLRSDEFAATADRTGAIGPIGAYALRAACAQVVAWRDDEAIGDLRLIVSVSHRQLSEPGFADMVTGTLAETRLAGDRLTLGVTDSQSLNAAASSAAIEAVAARGVRVAVHDFGVGPVSLASLGSHPIHQIKISGAHSDDADATWMFEMALSIAGILKVETVADGVDTEAQATAVRVAGVTMARGPYYALTMPAGEFPAWVHDRRSASVSVGVA